MALKNLSKSQYRFLDYELKEQMKRDLITENQLEEIMKTYEESEGLNFIKVILSVGAVLIGLGILSFIASNWIHIGRVIKLLVIFLALGGTLLTSYKTEINSPKISKAFLYLSTLIFGAGIFLIGQIFHLGGTWSDAFLIWTIGTIAMAFLSKDLLISIFAHLLAATFILSGFDKNIIILGLFVTALFYALNKYYNYSSVMTFFTNLISLIFILYLCNYFEIEAFYTIVLFFLIGLGMYYMKHPLNLHVFQLQGLIVLSLSGLLLTIDEIWRDIFHLDYGGIFSIVFGICFLIYLLSLVKKQLLTPLIFTCAIIMRYYFDTLYDFLPKSMFFIFGGMILLSFGVYFERVRKKRGGDMG